MSTETEILGVRTLKNGQFVQKMDDAMQDALQDFLHPKKAVGKVRKIRGTVAIESDKQLQAGTVQYYVERLFPGEQPESGDEAVVFSVSGDDEVIARRFRAMPQRLPLGSEDERPRGTLSAVGFSLMTLAGGAILDEMDRSIRRGAMDIDDAEKSRTAERKVILELYIEINEDLSGATLTHVLEEKFPQKKKREKDSARYQIDLQFDAEEGSPGIALQQSLDMPAADTANEEA